MVLFKNVRVWTTQEARKQAILNRTRQNKDIIYGARSIQRRLGMFARPTNDFDIFTANPKKSAIAMEKKFDNLVGFDYFYTKKAMHKGTWKVKGKGMDMKKGTMDDEDIIDYSGFPKPIPSFNVIDGVRFRTLTQEKRAKKKTIKDPSYKFRKEKDLNDLSRIKLFESIL